MVSKTTKRKLVKRATELQAKENVKLKPEVTLTEAAKVIHEAVKSLPVKTKKVAKSKSVDMAVVANVLAKLYRLNGSYCMSYIDLCGIAGVIGDRLPRRLFSTLSGILEIKKIYLVTDLTIATEFHIMKKSDIPKKVTKALIRSVVKETVK